MPNLYYSAARVSEASEQIWERTMDRVDGQMQITIHGKGGKTRHVLLSKFLANDLRALRDEAEDSDPAFRSQKANAASGIHPYALSTKAIEQIISMADVPNWLIFNLLVF